MWYHPDKNTMNGLLKITDWRFTAHMPSRLSHFIIADDHCFCSFLYFCGYFYNFTIIFVVNFTTLRFSNKYILWFLNVLFGFMHGGDGIRERVLRFVYCCKFLLWKRVWRYITSKCFSKTNARKKRSATGLFGFIVASKSNFIILLICNNNNSKNPNVE